MATPWTCPNCGKTTGLNNRHKHVCITPETLERVRLAMTDDNDSTCAVSTREYARRASRFGAPSVWVVTRQFGNYTEACVHFGLRMRPSICEARAASVVGRESFRHATPAPRIVLPGRQGLPVYRETVTARVWNLPDGRRILHTEHIYAVR